MLSVETSASFPSHDAIVASLVSEDPDFDARTTLQKMGIATSDDVGLVEISPKIDVLVPRLSASDIRVAANFERIEANEMNAEFDAALPKPEVSQADVLALANRAVKGRLTEEEREAVIVPKKIGHPKPSQKEAQPDVSVAPKNAKAAPAPKVAAPVKVAAPKVAAKPALPVIKLKVGETYRYAGPGPWNDKPVKLISFEGSRAQVSLIAKPGSKSGCASANLAAI
jgi:hypothetical protein